MIENEIPTVIKKQKFQTYIKEPENRKNRSATRILNVYVG